MSGYQMYQGKEFEGKDKPLITKQIKNSSVHDARSEDVSKHESKEPKQEGRKVEDLSQDPSLHTATNPSSGWLGNIKKILISPLSIIKTDEVFENALLEDTSLEEFLSQLTALKIKISDEKEEGRFILFNSVIKPIKHAVRVKIAEKQALIIELASNKFNMKKKLYFVSEFQKAQKSLIDESYVKIKEAESDLIEETKKELYDQLKQIIAHPIWDAQVRMYGGKVVLNDDNKEVRVPTGIEQMMRVVTNFPLPKKKSCCHFRFFSKTIPSSRVKAQKEEALDSVKVGEKINQIKEIAIQRLSKSDKRTDPTKTFYTAIQLINTSRLGDLKALNGYINKIKAIYAKDCLSYFQSTGDEAPAELVRLQSSPMRTV